MKIKYSWMVFLQYWRGIKVKGNAPYHGVVWPFVWFANPPPSNAKAEARDKEITDDLLRIEKKHDDLMELSPSDTDFYNHWIYQTRREMHCLLVEKAYIRKRMRRYFKRSRSRHELGNQKGDLLHIFAIELALELKYVTVHADRFPPDSIESAKRRCYFLSQQVNRTIRRLLERIKKRGNELKCSCKQIKKAQAHLIKISNRARAENVMIEHWIEVQERQHAIPQGIATADSGFGIDTQPA